MLRVGREAVVSFPNFAYWKNRQAVLNGRMPVSEDLPYEWYDSPNLRFSRFRISKRWPPDGAGHPGAPRSLDEGPLGDRGAQFPGQSCGHRLSRSR